MESSLSYLVLTVATFGVGGFGALWWERRTSRTARLDVPIEAAELLAELARERGEDMGLTLLRALDALAEEPYDEALPASALAP